MKNLKHLIKFLLRILTDSNLHPLAINIETNSTMHIQDFDALSSVKLLMNEQ